MQTIRVQNSETDTVYMTAVQGVGTNVFQASNQPNRYYLREDFGVVLTGNLKVTKSDTSGGYFFLLTKAPRDTHNKRTFFRGDALVRCGDRVLTVENYYKMLEALNGK